MLNNVNIVGRLVREPKKERLESGVLTCVISLAIPRNYKNSEGAYDTDFVDVRLFSNLAGNTIEYCKKGDVIGVRGRIETKIIENENNEKIRTTEIIAEKVYFLASSK